MNFKNFLLLNLFLALNQTVHSGIATDIQIINQKLDALIIGFQLNDARIAQLNDLLKELLTEPEVIQTPPPSPILSQTSRRSWSDSQIRREELPTNFSPQRPTQNLQRINRAPAINQKPSTGRKNQSPAKKEAFNRPQWRT